MTSTSPVRVHALLGMHRSGTSWLAGTLQELGLPFGPVNESATYNAKGTRENETLQHIHVAVLRESNGSWRDPPKRVTWQDERRKALAAFVAGMNAQYAQWGFKDPRTLLLLDEWQRLVPNLEFVGIFRHPEAVARSLAKRKFSPVDRRPALALWKAYNERLVALHRRTPFPILRFDIPRDELLAGVAALTPQWNLSGADRPGEFFDADLVHEAAGDERVPMSCRRIWNYLVDNTHVL
jgi:hypothetical protein